MKLWFSLAAVVLTIVAVVAGLGLTVGAHHASGPFYDNTKSVEVDGEVTRFLLRNPHSFVYLDGANADGEVVGWEVEMGTALSMSRRGWTTDTIQVGDRIKVVGQPSRAPGTYGICCAEITQRDGSPIRPAN